MERFSISGLIKSKFLVTKRLLLLFKTHLKVTVGRLSPMLKPLQTHIVFNKTPRIYRFSDVFIVHQQTRAVFSAFRFQVNINQESAI